MLLFRILRSTIRRSFALSVHNFDKKKGSLATEYVRKSPIEHILLRPETYIGSVFAVEQKNWFYNGETKKMEQRTSIFSPGIVKIFDEILVNATDCKQKDPRMSAIRVDVDREKNVISVWNDGQTLPIEIHPIEGVYISSLVFGNLFTSSNYDDDTLRTVGKEKIGTEILLGGRNGFGAKLCNVYSEVFTVETGEKEKRKIFKQSWKENMKVAGEVRIIEGETEDFTKVIFSPDLAKFGIKKISEDLVEIFRKRVFDVAGTLPGVQVFFNGENISIHSFNEYIKLFCDDFLYLNYSPRWKVGVALSPSGFQQISFVNNISTTKGGKHVDMVAEKIVFSLKAILEEQIGGRIRPSLIKNHLSLFVNCLVENPSFESQTKEFLCTPVKKFGSTFEPNEEELLEWTTKSGLLELISEEIHGKKPSKKSSKVKLEEVPKLEDASLAGTSKGRRCSLLVTEGDSAKAFAVAGLEIVGRDLFGVFPIRGKLINVSEIEAEKAALNVEVGNLMKILGLKFGVDYGIDENFSALRYGSIVILADQDEDGSHIKGLILNLFHHFWPELLTRKFVSSFRTPLVKAKKESKSFSFFSLGEFNKWQQKEKGFSIKYYKGLGTSTSAEAREYFGNLDNHLITYTFDKEFDGQQLKMAFDKSSADERKLWIAGKKRESDEIKEFKKEQTIREFIDEELVNYSLADLRRSIPSVVDGLKPSQRKVLWCLLRMKERKEIKVNQLAGAVSIQGYHHGEESLVETIVKMAQNFPGSNNLNLLKPIGQFGTRHAGGSDAARGRYIFTSLSRLARIIFPKSDDPLLSFIHEDGHPAEPKTFYPIVPLVLINGVKGIGTGWSSHVLPNRPSKVIDAVKRLIEEKEFEELKPWWRGFGGSVTQLAQNRYSLEGRMAILKKSETNSKVEITELPAGIWTNKYKEKVLLPLLKSGEISNLKEQHTERNVRFEIVMNGPNKKKNLFSMLRLSSILSTNSMVLFDCSDSLRTYQTTGDILREHFLIRKEIYARRLAEEEKKQETQLSLVENQLRFVRAVVDGEISLANRSQEELENELQKQNFATNPLLQESDNYSYLLSMSLLRLTREEISFLEHKSSEQRKQLAEIRKSSWQDEWLSELTSLTKEINRNLDG